MPEIFDASRQNQSKKTSSQEPSSNLDTNQLQPRQNHATKKNTKNSKKRSVNEYSETINHEPIARNPLTAFAAKPDKVRFDSQLDEEEIVLMLRRHPVTQVKKIAIIVIALFLPLLIFSGDMLGFLTPKLKIAAIVGWYVLVTSFSLEAFLVWFFNVFIVTDERIIDVDFLSLIYKNVSSAKIDSIEDITVATGGVLASLVDFGTVYIQTAGENPELQFEEVPQPAKVARALNELILEEEREKIEGRVS